MTHHDYDARKKKKLNIVKTFPSHRRKSGIHETNKYGKRYVHHIKPILVHCVNCGRKNKYHHFLCERCWHLQNKIMKIKE